MRQTAVEWLEEKWRNYDLNLGKSGFNLFIKQALEGEKKQIMNAYYTGNDDVKDNPDREAEQYYNETFKSK